MKTLLTGALAAFALGAASLPAQAHAYLVESYPAKQQSVVTPLHRIKMVFSGKADALYSTIKLRNAKGAVVAEVTQKEASREMILPTPVLEPGAYHIHYRILSVDGDIVEGKVDFTVFGVEA
jgi:methionine-rich copper-binding protein CopC